MMPPEPAPVQQPWPAPDNQGVREWQEQAAAGQLASGQTGHQSSIFGQKKARPAGQGSGFVSMLFGRNKKEEYDGLSDGSTLSPEEAAKQLREAAKPPRRTATGEEIRQPQTHWAPAPQAEERPEAPVRREEPAAPPAAGNTV